MIHEFPDFPSDRSKENPDLHMFYVKQAVKHLGIIDKMIDKLYKQSNLNVDEFARGLEVVRAKKVAEDAAYRDASEMLHMARTGKDLPAEVGDEAEEAAA